MCVVLAGLELVHPAFADDAVPEPLTAVWVPLHGALLIGYALLVATLYRTSITTPARVTLVVFVLLNTAYLVVDGLVLGPHAPPDPAVTLLANATGALWCAALLTRAAATTVDRTALGLLILTWLSFAATAFGVPLIVSRAVAIATMAWLGSTPTAS